MTPTPGQQLILRLASGYNRRLRALDTPGSGDQWYAIVEIRAAAPPRFIRRVELHTVRALVTAGWLEPASGARGPRDYLVTEAGAAISETARGEGARGSASVERTARDSW